jgi:hypothetical protein
MDKELEDRIQKMQRKRKRKRKRKRIRMIRRQKKSAKERTENVLR